MVKFRVLNLNVSAFGSSEGTFQVVDHYVDLPMGGQLASELAAEGTIRLVPVETQIEIDPPFDPPYVPPPPKLKDSEDFMPEVATPKTRKAKK